ncbi:snake venom 5'-nucleotidase-like [Mercenaria mercenaria]|uniref:snake venom 5'-nucleotidase-like n=1 Tax=Mercenaria mercenaria TaxID=6596 RepID=UPI00234E9700|nr:snake venom 5'-nucleotidase-like [Mercenaria mercenaria]
MYIKQTLFNKLSFIFGIIVISFSSFKIVSGFELTVLHTNDVHARFEQFNKYGSKCSENDAKNGKCFGGVARRLSKIQEIRNSHDNVLLLDAGDQFMGTTWFNVYHGRATSYFMNQLGYSAMCLGNHEFDLGVEPLALFLNNVTFPIVSVNTEVTNEPRLNGKFLKSFEMIVGGENIGIVGYIIPETSQISKPGQTVNFDNILTTVGEEVSALKSKGINKIIALGHAGFNIDKQVAAIDGIDLVVGGHTNTFLYNGNMPAGEEIEGPYPLVADQPGGGQGLVVQAYTMGKYLGYLNVTFDSNGVVTKYSGNPILLDSRVKEDPAVLSFVNEWKKPVDALAEEIIGYSKVVLDGSRVNCRSKECNLGNLITDAIIDYHVNFSHPASNWAPAAIALWNGGGIRASIDKGDVSAGEAMAVMPFGNEIDVATVKGKNIREQLETSVKEWSPKGEHGRFLQMSGLKVVYNTNNPVGKRVVSVEARCLECEVPSYSPLQDEANYKIFLSTFLLGGGDGYNFKPSQRERFNTLDLTTVMGYFKKHSPVFPSTEGRIRFTSSATKLSAVTFFFILELLIYFFIIIMIFVFLFMILTIIIYRSFRFLYFYTHVFVKFLLFQFTGN